jgi:hypothetical protein
VTFVKTCSLFSTFPPTPTRGGGGTTEAAAAAADGGEEEEKEEGLSKATATSGKRWRPSGPRPAVQFLIIFLHVLSYIPSTLSLSSHLTAPPRSRTAKKLFFKGRGPGAGPANRRV